MLQGILYNKKVVFDGVGVTGECDGVFLDVVRVKGYKVCYDDILRVLRINNECELSGWRPGYWYIENVCLEGNYWIMSINVASGKADKLKGVMG